MWNWIKRNDTMLLLAFTSAAAGHSLAEGDYIWAGVLAACAVWDAYLLRK